MVGDATLHFSDASSTLYSGAIDLSDWYIASPGNPNIVVSAMGGRVNTTGGTAGAAFEATPGTGPKFYVSVITLTGADLNKNLTSITFGNFPFGGNTFQFVMGLAGVPSPPIFFPTITKTFGAATIAVNGTTSLSFTITNPNVAFSVSGVAVTDTLPAGLVVSTPNGLTGTCGGGTITAVAGSGSVSLTGATLAGGGSCTFAVNVTGTTAGVKSNTTGTISSTEGGTGSTASASVTVSTLPPTITK